MHQPLLLAGLSLINMSTYGIYSHWLTLILTDLPPLSMVPAQVPLVWLRFMKKTWQADVNSLGTFSLAGLFWRGGDIIHISKMHLSKMYNSVVFIHSQSCTTVTIIKFQNIYIMLRVPKFKFIPTPFHQVLGTGEYANTTSRVDIFICHKNRHKTHV